MPLEYLEGQTLKDYIRIHQTQNNQITLLDFLQFSISMVHVLAQIHHNQVIHKDFNPKNVILQDDGTTWIIDFGIADILKKQAQKESPDNFNHLEGTLAYISPEQTGRMNRSIDHRSDLYSLGVTLYELWTNQLPFPEEDDTMEMIHHHLAKTPHPIHKYRSDTPLVIRLIIEKLLAKIPENRYQSTYGLLHDLERGLQHLQKEGSIPNFTLGQADFLDRFCIPEKLYGRDKERQELLRLFQTVTTGNLEMILIAGFSGIGKTALVNEIHKPIIAQRGSFIEGKFEQYQKDTPYSAIIEAIKDFTEQLLAKPQAQIEKWKKRILESVGVNGQVLIDVIPTLEGLLGKQPPVPELPPTETQNRFRSLFQQFIRAVSTEKHPLVIFLDDWQWADLGSIELLKALIIDNQNQYLLILCAYRSNEVTKVHPFMLALEAIQNSGKKPHKIKLQALPIRDINELISDTLHLDKSQTKPLAQLMNDKTEGNPFFLTQLFTSLYENGEIVYNHEVKKWEWDMTHIANLDVTGNVVELMVSKIQKLDERTQQVLQTASCIGNKFALTILASLAEKSQKNILDDLWQALEEGLITTISGNPYAVEESTIDAGVHFKFLHDRVEQAAYSLVSDEVKKESRLQIGRSLLAQQSAEYIEEFLFDIVNYLNAGKELMTEHEEIVRLTKLNLRAGKKAKKATAYVSALEFYDNALAIVESAKQDELLYEIYKEKGEIEFLLGNFNNADITLDTAIKYSNNELEKIDIYILQVARMTQEGQYLQAIMIAIKAVNLLGIGLPTVHLETNVKGDVMLVADDMKRFDEINKELTDFYLKTIAECTPESLEDLPLIEDDKRVEVASYIVSLCLDIAVIAAPHLLNMFVFKVFEMSINYGLTPSTPLGYAWLAVCISGFKDFNRAHRFASVAVKLNEGKLDNPIIRGRVTHIDSYMKILNGTYKEATDGQLRTYTQAANVGDQVYAAYGLSVGTRFCMYQSLIEAEKIGQNAIKYCADTNSIGVLYVTHGYMGYSRSLSEYGVSDDFSYDDFKEEEYLELFDGGKVPLFMTFYYRYKLQGFYILGQYEKAVEKALKIGYDYRILAEGIDIVYRGQYYFYMGLALTAYYNTKVLTDTIELTMMSGKKEQKPINELFNQCLEELKLMMDEFESNFKHKYLTLLAEKECISGHIWKALELYDEALNHAKANSFVQHEGVINELIAKLYLTQNKPYFAEFHIKAAQHAFQRWGANAKARQLEEKYTPFFNRTPTERAGTVTVHQTIHQTTQKGITAHTPQGATSTLQSIGLDFQTIIKASQAISGEVKLDTLLSKMLDIVMENAGAGRGVIIRPLNNKFHILADRAIEEVHQIIHDNELKTRLPLTLIRYASHSQNTIVLDDARKNKTYGADTYIIQNDVKSILCMPVIQQGKVSILIYLENKLVDYAFSSGRVNTLNLLMGQVAVSFENALLYDNMEQEIEKQTSEIKDKSTRITASINYAQNIQNAILPSTELLNQLYDDHYVLYLPKDIVSGDFYWARKTQKYIFTGVVDCTGHGVPGAFMSMIGKTLLDEILNEKGIHDPATILLQLHQSVRASLRQEETDNDDGMDLALIRLEYQNHGVIELVFSGAKRPLFMISQGQFIELKGDRKSIGGHSAVVREFTNKTYSLKSGDILYLLSDGITDVASPKRKMFGKKRVRELIQKYAHVQSLKQQGEMLYQAMKAHQQDTEQRDDITVMGLKIK